MSLRVFGGVCAPILLFFGALWACEPPKPPEVVESIVDAGPPDLGPPDTKPKTLYDRMGGKDAVAIVVEALIDRASKDPKLKPLFAKVTGDRLTHLKQMLNEELCSLADGGCTYSGKDLREAHTGMKLTDAHWNAFVAALGDALKDAKISDDDQNELLLKIAPLKDDVLNRTK